MADQTATTYAGQLGYAGRTITNAAEPTVYPAADGGPDVRLIPRHKVRTTDHLATPVTDDAWRDFGEAVLKFHQRVAATAMCNCGHSWRACDVWRQAEKYGIRQLPQ